MSWKATQVVWQLWNYCYILLLFQIISNYFKFMQFLFDLETARLCKTSWFWFRVVHDAPSQRIRSAPAISASFSVTKAPRAACKALRQLGASWNLVTSWWLWAIGHKWWQKWIKMVPNPCVKKSVTKVAWKTWNFWLESTAPLRPSAPKAPWNEQQLSSIPVRLRHRRVLNNAKHKAQAVYAQFLQFRK